MAKFNWQGAIIMLIALFTLFVGPTTEAQKHLGAVVILMAMYVVSFMDRRKQ